MKENKPKSIRIIGVVLIVISVLSIVSNIRGVFMVGHLTEAGSNLEHIPSYFQSLASAKPSAMISLALALEFLVAGIFITRYKNWARVSAQIGAVIYLLFFWY